jgi:hypothetical protein
VRVKRCGTIKHRVDIGFSNAAAVRKTLWSYDIAKSPQPGARAKEQCLGDMPWKHRATAIKPGEHYLVQSVARVKSRDLRTMISLVARGTADAAACCVVATLAPEA